MYFFTLGPNKLLNIKSNWDLFLNNMKGKTDVFFMIVSGLIRKMYIELKHFFFIRTKDKVSHFIDTSLTFKCIYVGGRLILRAGQGKVARQK